MLDRESGAPLYRQIADDLARQIVDGELRPGSALPSEADLCSHYGVSRITVRSALELLRREGLIERGRGKGTVVRYPMQTASTEAGLVGIIVPTAQGTFTPPIIEGASLALADHGYTLTVGISHGDPVRERLEVARLRRHPGCVGLLLLPLEESEDYDVIQNLYASRFPLVLIDHFPSEIPVDAVVSDDYHAGYEAASHLLDLGHRHVVFITSISERTSSVAARLTGFRQAVADRQIPLLQAPSLVVPRAPLPDDPSHRSWVRIEERIAKWLAAHPEVTGVITVHDRLATHVIRVARSLGRRVPEDLAIVSFGDYLSGEIQETPLTSVAMDLRGLGREAVRLLLSRLAEPQRSPVRVTLPTQLVIRASSDPSRVVLPIGT